MVDEEQEEKRNEETKQKRVWNLLKLDEEREGKSKTSNDGELLFFASTLTQF